MSHIILEPLNTMALLTTPSFLKFSPPSQYSLRFSDSSFSAVILQSNLLSLLYYLRILVSAFLPVTFSLDYLVSIHLLLYLYISDSILNFYLCPAWCQNKTHTHARTHTPQSNFHRCFTSSCLCSLANISCILSI